MAKVYVVCELYHEHNNDHSDYYNSEIIQKVFDDEVKAIDYICDRIKEDHECVNTWSINEQQATTKYELDENRIREGSVIESWERIDDDVTIVVTYRYESYDVE